MYRIPFFVLIIMLVACQGADNPEVENNEGDTTTDTLDTIAPEATEVNKSVEYHPNGNIKMEGKLNDNGRREGLWIAYYENGTKWSESYYVDGLRDGHNLSFYPNGRIRYIGEYKQDVKVGTWKFYNDDGTLATEETY